MEAQLQLANVCADLVYLRESEPFVVQLLQKEGAKRFAVAEAADASGVNLPDLANLGPDLFVTWLDDPMGDKDYAIILFYDRDSKWTTSAEYHRRRLSPVG
jgi:hypothetical protein